MAGGPVADDSRYRAIFEYAAVSLWEKDISRLRARLREIRRDGIDLRSHLAAHPEFIQEAVGLIEVTDVNQATLRLLEIPRKEMLLGPIRAVLTDVSRAAMSQTILAIDEGRSDVEVESTVVTPAGKTLYLIAKSYIPPADSAYDRLLLSFIDITAERKNANILRSIIDSFPGSVFVKDTSLRMVLCNTALTHAIGKEPEETYGKTDIEAGWNPDLVKGNAARGIEGWEKDDLAALAGETVRVPAETSEAGGGATRHYETFKFPLRDPSGAILGIVGVGRDVTERVRAEAELKKAKDFSENLIHTANVMVLCLDKDGRVVLINEAAERITGYSLEDLQGASWFETVVPRNRYPEVWVKFEKLSRERDTGAFQNPILTKSGEERYVAWQNSQIVEEGRVTGTLSFGIDITDRRRVEEELARERTFFNILMENLPDQIYFKDRESRYLRNSRSHARALGMGEPADVRGRSDHDFFSPETARRFHANELEIMRTGVPQVDIEERQAYPDRPDTWVSTTKMPFRIDDGAILGTFGISRDITQRKRLLDRNQQLATLVESSDDAIVGMGMDRRITVWNHGAERIYGYTAQEMIGSPTAPLIPEELEEEARQMREKLGRGERIEHFETTRLRKDGTRIIVSLTLSAIHDEAGRMVGMASVARDVTAQKALQAQLGAHAAAGEPRHARRRRGSPVQQHQHRGEGLPGDSPGGEGSFGTASRLRVGRRHGGEPRRGDHGTPAAHDGTRRQPGCRGEARRADPQYRFHLCEPAVQRRCRAGPGPAGDSSRGGRGIAAEDDRHDPRHECAGRASGPTAARSGHEDWPRFRRRFPGSGRYRARDPGCGPAQDLHPVLLHKG